jgi:Glycosyl-transferase family 4
VALRSDLVILNTAVAGKWLDGVLKEKVPQVLPKVLWWIHEMRGHYFKLEYVKHLPYVAGTMIDSYVTAAYWKNRTSDRLKYVYIMQNSAYIFDSICHLATLSCFFAGTWPYCICTFFL